MNSFFPLNKAAAHPPVPPPVPPAVPDSPAPSVASTASTDSSAPSSIVVRRNTLSYKQMVSSNQYKTTSYTMPAAPVIVQAVVQPKKGKKKNKKRKAKTEYNPSPRAARAKLTPPAATAGTGAPKSRSPARSHRSRVEQNLWNRIPELWDTLHIDEKEYRYQPEYQPAAKRCHAQGH